MRIFVTHGHLYGVKRDLTALAGAAKDAGARLALFGHTHIQHLEERGGITLLNPGTAGRFGHSGYAVVEIKDGAFSKISLSSPITLIPAVINGQPDFEVETRNDELAWQQIAISNGQAWITQLTAGLFQPQELRLHQRNGVDYDKGCYLGQEIVARLYFRAKPKAWLHRIAGSGELPQAGQQLTAEIQVVNAAQVDHGWQALVIAKPTALADGEFSVLDLPDSLNGEVGRVI